MHNPGRGRGGEDKGGEGFLGYEGSREGAGIVDVKSRMSMRRGESPSKAARGPASWKSKLWAKAVCAAWVRSADHRAMNAWAAGRSILDQIRTETALSFNRAGRAEKSAGRPKRSAWISCVREFQVDHFMELRQTDIGKL